MTIKTYPTSSKGWIKYLTVDKYYTPKEIEYRKELINLESKSFTFIETQLMRDNVNRIKNFWKSDSCSLKESYKKN
ncbi:MAG: hypothetical protein JJV95_02780 [Sulfurospirillum sp.]|nr:hypothetical protein [Sulfurospirillum sp.]MBL0702896.1 hypothetical protein [Sulfurospirillum sp.]